MDLIDRLEQLSARIRKQKDAVMTEEAAKTAFVLPFLQSLGYDVFNPSEVIPELNADHGVKKGEKVDYGIMQDGKIAILIECKPVGADLQAKHAGQLYRYFSVTDARFGLLTDGVRYLFFSDLDRQNKMDDRPFFVFDMLSFGEADVEELKKFAKSSFDLDTIISTASNLKYHRALVGEISKEISEPSEDLTRLLTIRVYSGRFTQQIKDQFSELVKRAFDDVVTQRVNARLKSALEGGGKSPDAASPQTASPSETSLPPTEASKSHSDTGIETTEEEIAAHMIIRAIAAEFVEVERVVMRDAKSYCAILMDDNNRRPICRLYFGKKQMAVGIFVPSGEDRKTIAKVSDLYLYREDLKQAICQYE